MSQNDRRVEPGYIDSDIPREMEMWRKAVVHLEGATDIKTVSNRIRISDNYKNEIHTRRFWGTAIFIEHNKKRFLITPRHVVHDTIRSSAFIKKLEERSTSPAGSPIRTAVMHTAHQQASNFIFNVIYKVPSLNEFMEKTPKGLPAFILGLGATPYESASYTFLEPQFDLAIISLDRENALFAEKLLAQGYEPVSSKWIQDMPREVGVEVFTIGYPIMPALFDKLAVDHKEEIWKTGFISVPTFSFGTVSELMDQYPYFKSAMDLYSGNPGSPVVAHDRIVGIINKHNVISRQDSLSIHVLKAKYIRNLIDMQVEKDNVVTRNASR